MSWSADAKFLLYNVADPGNADVWVLPLTGDRKPIPYMPTTANEAGARFSPDGRWVAYSSNQTGRGEVFVAPFPATGGRMLVSTAGAVLGTARWRRDGRELFYLGPNGSLMVAEVDGRGVAS